MLEKMENFLKVMPCGAVVIDNEGEILFHNDEVIKIFDHEESKVELMKQKVKFCV